MREILSLCNEIRLFKISLKYSFICYGTSTRKKRRDLFGFRVKLPPVTIHSQVEAIPLSALLKDTTSELVGLS